LTIRIIVLAILAALTVADPAAAQSLTLDFGGDSGDAEATGRLIQLIGLITVLSLAPSLLVMVTSFTRIVVVFSLLRSALGVQQAPPNQVLISLALFLTAFIMMPTFERAYEIGIQPMLDGTMEEMEAFEKTVEPFHAFMSAHVREEDVGLFLELAQIEEPIQSVEDVPLRALVPAFMISELRRAFEIGFLVFVPFLIIDMVVASVLMSMGMMMLPPVIIALPFKIVFFVLVDGWHLLVGSLVRSFGTP
jgi:flagellar biosynthetic protein FliP